MIATTDTPRASIRADAFASLAAAAFAVPMAALAAEETESDTIGPWEIEATFKGDSFDRCAINRKLDNEVVASFVRTGDGLTLELQSPIGSSIAARIIR